MTTNAKRHTLYKRLPTTCSLCITSLEECAMRMAPCRTYTLHTGHALYTFASMLLKRIGATTQEHPFAPYISLIELNVLTSTEWFIKSDAGEAWGSEGL